MQRISCCGVLLLLISGCNEASKPEQHQSELQKAFDNDAVLVKTCASDSGSAAGGPVSVYRFRDEMWFRDGPNRVLRRVDATLENVCDVLHPPRSTGPASGKSSP
jgi:hypothetical protein